MVLLRDIPMHMCNLLTGPPSQNAGTAPPSFCSTLLQESDPTVVAARAIEEFDVKWTANSMYAASLDTVTSFFVSFALVRYLTILPRQ